MKKSLVVMGIISGVILLFGIIFMMSFDFSNASDVSSVIVMYGVLTYRLIVFSVTLGFIALVWLVYGLINLIKKKKGIGLVITCILIPLIIFFGVLSVINKIGNYESPKNYDFSIRYQDGANIYNIYQDGNDTYVYSSLEVECIKEPCDNVDDHYKIEFSDENKSKVTQFMNGIHDEYDYDRVVVRNETLDIKEYNILRSIIFNTEKYMNINNYKYVIITDSIYSTMQNDGGSYTNIYYEFDFSGNKVTKYEDKYVGMVGYDYKDKVIYEKNIDADMMKSIYYIVDNLFDKNDISGDNDYKYFVIEYDSTKKEIYNEKSIESLKDVIKVMDNY